MVLWSAVECYGVLCGDGYDVRCCRMLWSTVEFFGVACGFLGCCVVLLGALGCYGVLWE